MPTAVASFDDAFDMDEPTRKGAPRKRPAAGKGRKRSGKKKIPRFPFDGQRIARFGALGMSGGLVVAILVNALVLQKGHHPAPLFGKSIALGPSPVPTPKPPAPERTAPAIAAEPTETTASANAQHARVAASTAAPQSGDPIGALIEGHAPSPQSTAQVDGKTVLGAQKALAKLGFALKPSGTMGPQTRKAIETFERDRHLPVNGELTHRVVKILAAESGIRID